MRRVADERLGEIHQVQVVPVGCIELHHSEFGVVPHADTFIAVTAVDLEHALEPSDNEPFQVQLRRNAQEHFLIERVVMGFERLGVGAAGDRVQHRGFDFQEVMRNHEFSNAANGLAACNESFARGFVRHQIDIPLAVFHLLIGHAVEFIGHGAKAFRQQAQRRCMDG